MKRQPMASRRDELDEFKRRINLTEYAAANGYCLDRKASSRNSAVMVHPAGDKIIVAKGDDQHWVYFSVRDDRDNGSIIDFEQRRHGGSMGDVRKVLRPWLSGGSIAGIVRPAPETFSPKLDPIHRDLIAVRLRYEAMKPIDGQHQYLEEVRKIPAHIRTDPLFADRIRIDQYKNAIFPHYNKDGLCGYEMKNRNITGFASGATKGLWCSQIGSDDRRLVIAETAIDALSYAAIKGQPYSRYVSTAGELNPDQPFLLEAAMKKLPAGGQVVLAVDHDAGGDKIGAKIEAIFLSIGRSQLALVRDVPLTVGNDWNDQLRSAVSIACPAPAYRPKFAG
jgi:Toprim-like/Protein of unknown function (DUF3991)